MGAFVSKTCNTKEFPWPSGDAEELRTLKLSMNCDLEAWCAQGLNNPKELGTAWTLVGNVEQAYVTTVQDYVEQFWPNPGTEVLSTLCTLIQLPKHAGSRKIEGIVWNTTSPVPLKAHYPLSSSYMELSDTSCGTTTLTLEIAGTRSSLRKLVEIMAWIACCFQSPQRGVLSYSSCELREVKQIGRQDPLRTHLEIKEQPLQPVHHEVQPVQPTSWIPLFPNWIIACNFPVPERQEQQGLEVSEDHIDRLLHLHYPVQSRGCIVFSKDCTLVLPMTVAEDFIQWRCMRNQNPEKINADAVLQAYPGTAQITNLPIIWTRTHFIA